MASTSAQPVMDDTRRSERASSELPDEPGPSGEPKTKTYKRSRSGCFTCRLRRKKCDETRPICSTCTKLGLKCNYVTPKWWATKEQRGVQKERIKERIRQTKVMEKEGNLQKYRDRISALVPKPPESEASSSSHAALMGQASTIPQSLPTPVTPNPNPFQVQQDVALSTGIVPATPVLPQSSPVPQTSFLTQTPTLSQSATFPQTPALPPTPLSAPPTSTFGQSPITPQVQTFTSTSGAPQLQLVSRVSIQPSPQTETFTRPPLPQYSGQGPSSVPPPTPRLPHRELARPPFSLPQPYNQDFFESMVDGSSESTDAQLPLYESVRGLISVDNNAQPLLQHFVDHVLHTVFPILEARQGPRLHINEILGLMQNNRAYLRCCLSAAAIHLKYTLGLDDQLDHDIMEHRYAAISQLSNVLNRESGHMQNLDATLGLIFYNSFVATSEDYLDDIPWSHHFKGAASLIKKLINPPSSLSVALVAWIDIIGATMLGATPEFSHTYRQRHVTGIRSGLQHVMGCDDRIMYLISEIACLESLWLEGSLEELDLYQHVFALNEQINWTEATDSPVEAPYDSNGVIIADKLVTLITALFRLAARLYAHSILPTFDSYDATVMSWVTRIGDIIQMIPTGRTGYDRCLAWPLFIAGLYSVPPSQFRKILSERIAALGCLGKFGSIGRVYRVLTEFWRIADATASLPGSGTRPPKSRISQSVAAEEAGQSLIQQHQSPLDVQEEDQEHQDGEQEAHEEQSPEPQSQEQHGEEHQDGEKESEEPEKRYIHWREVMRANNWDYLLM
ncbi:hypothetical protein AnigIFM50267_004384 [Aspergillus niger]|nr:hypothetical protein AnigIFM50267_004384 [Aspergillus niger]